MTLQPTGMQPAGRRLGGHIMALRFRITVFDRDSIGPEIMQPTTEILGLLADRSGYAFDFVPCAAGAAY